MNGPLKLVADNPGVKPLCRTSGAALHALANRLAAGVRAGDAAGVRSAVAREALSPIGIAAVATWMLRAGLNESEIMSVMG